MITWREPAPGMLDAIAEKDTGYVPDFHEDNWLDEAIKRRGRELAALREPKPGDLECLYRSAVYASRYRLPDKRPGRDCPSCPAPRDKHDEYGCLPTGCPRPHWMLVPVRVGA